MFLKENLNVLRIVFEMFLQLSHFKKFYHKMDTLKNIQASQKRTCHFLSYLFAQIYERSILRFEKKKFNY